MWDQLSADSKIALSCEVSSQLIQGSYYHEISCQLVQVSYNHERSVISGFKDPTIMWDQLSAGSRILLSFEISCQLIQGSYCNVRSVINWFKDPATMWIQMSAVSVIILSCKISFQLLQWAFSYVRSESPASRIILSCNGSCQLLQESPIMWDLLSGESVDSCFKNLQVRSVVSRYKIKNHVKSVVSCFKDCSVIWNIYQLCQRSLLHVSSVCSFKDHTIMWEHLSAALGSSYSYDVRSDVMCFRITLLSFSVAFPEIAYYHLCPVVSCSIGWTLWTIGAASGKYL
jgi:hypothetical protein